VTIPESLCAVCRHLPAGVYTVAAVLRGCSRGLERPQRASRGPLEGVEGGAAGTAQKPSDGLPGGAEQSEAPRELVCGAGLELQGGRYRCAGFDRCPGSDDGLPVSAALARAHFERGPATGGRRAAGEVVRG
jgi:hypothetical protein